MTLLANTIITDTFETWLNKTNLAFVRINSFSPAANTISGDSIANTSITTVKIADSNITTPKMADLGVTTVKLADTAVTTAKLTDASVSTAKLADLNVTSVKLATDAVITDKIADNSVTQAKLGFNIETSVDSLTAKTTNANLALAGNGTGKVSIGDASLLMPDVDGAVDQVLKTDGAGNLTFGDAGGGGSLYKGNNGTQGSSAGDIFRVNATVLTANVDILSTENASATGPISIGSGTTLSVAGTLVIL